VLAEGVQNPCFSADILVGREVKLGDGLSLFWEEAREWEKRCFVLMGADEADG